MEGYKQVSWKKADKLWKLGVTVEARFKAHTGCWYELSEREPLSSGLLKNMAKHYVFRVRVE